MGRKKKTLGHHLKYYCYILNVADEARIKPCGYQLQKALGQLPKKTDKVQVRNNKYDRYFYFGKKAPGLDTFKDIHAKYPQSSYILQLPIWEIFDEANQHEQFYNDLLIKMPAQIKKHIYPQYNPYQLKQIITHRNISSIERIGTVDALTSLLALFRLDEFKEIEVFTEISVEDNINRLMKMCCMQSPLDKIPGEIFEAVVAFLNRNYTAPDDYIVLTSRERFIYQIKNLRTVFEALLRWNIAEHKKNEIELMYWLLHCDENKFVEDYNRIIKKLPLNPGMNGLLWLLKKMSIKTRGLIHTLIMSLHDKFDAY
jgi:hypothetical protein